MKRAPYLSIIFPLLLIPFIKCFGQNAKIFNDRINSLSQTSRNNLEEDGDSEVSSNSENGIQSLPSLLSPFNGEQFRLIPKTNIAASKFVRKERGGSAYLGEIFTSASSSDTSFLNNGINFLIPQASSFGFHFQWLEGFYSSDKDKRLVFDLNLNILGKSLPNLDSDNNIIDNENVMVFQGSAGIEYLFLDDVLSGYININSITSISNVEFFESYFDTQNSFRIFPQFGLRAGFDVLNNSNSGSGDNTLFIDLGFIPNTGEISPFINSKDPLTPVINVGFNILFNKIKPLNSEENIEDSDFPETDSDKDGLPDAKEENGDTDEDGKVDRLDDDDDNDGVPTKKELDKDGNPKDENENGILDHLDKDFPPKKE